MVKKARSSQSNFKSAIVGAVLLSIGLVWLGWLLLSHTLSPSIPGLVATPSADLQIAPLFAKGIILGQADQPTHISQQQALLIANQFEPDAAVKAKSATAKYVQISYSNTNTSSTHPNMSNVPVWMIWYQNIPLEATDASVDPTPFPHSFHDLYIFLDANSGKELLVVSV